MLHVWCVNIINTRNKKDNWVFVMCFLLSIFDSLLRIVSFLLTNFAYRRRKKSWNHHDHHPEYELYWSINSLIPVYAWCLIGNICCLTLSNIRIDTCQVIYKHLHVPISESLEPFTFVGNAAPLTVTENICLLIIYNKANSKHPNSVWC